MIFVKLSFGKLKGQVLTSLRLTQEPKLNSIKFKET